MITDIITAPGAAFSAFRRGAGTGSFVTRMNSLVHTGL